MTAPWRLAWLVGFLAIVAGCNSAPQPRATPPDAFDEFGVHNVGHIEGTCRTCDLFYAAKHSVVQVHTPSGLGAGIVLTSNGLVATNAHVVGTDPSVIVETSDGEQAAGDVMIVDGAEDLALLMARSPSIRWPVLAMQFATPRVGTAVFLIGHPLGLGWTVTRGMISGQREIAGLPAIQIDAGISPGNSGGPVLDEEGHLLGIVMSKVQGGGAESIAFARPTAALEALLRRRSDPRPGPRSSRTVSHRKTRPAVNTARPRRPSSTERHAGRPARYLLGPGLSEPPLAFPEHDHEALELELTDATTTTDSFASTVRDHGTELRSGAIETVQVNIGAECNLACRHCHVESSPTRRERMTWPTMLQVLDAAEHLGAHQLDITGGAPELHPEFREFVSAARTRRLSVIVRTNLTILLRPEMSDLPEFFRENAVRLVASLPCYLGENVDRQRGSGVFEDSIEALRRLNDVGYGREPALELDLVYNPIGASLPPSQEALEVAYRAKLREQHDVEFTRLYALANMPIGRFAQDLKRHEQLDGYLSKLRASFNPRTLSGLMCRTQIHVGWDGRLYDCDFNFVLGMPVEPSFARHVGELLTSTIAPRRISTGEHCFGCTAGHGSSCGGALA